MRISIEEYNNIVGQLYIENTELFLLSPTLCRCEGQTFNYERYSNEKKNYSNYIFFLVKFLFKVIRDILFSLFSANGKLSSNDNSIFVFSFFDMRSIDGSFIREEYFRRILDNNNDVVCFYKLSTPGFFFRGKKYLDLISNKNKKFACYAEYSFISIVMILKALMLSLLHYFKFNKYKKLNSQKTKLENFILKSHNREIFDGTIYQGYLQKLLYERLFSSKPRLILSVWENQPWHRILESVKKNITPNTLSKGFQHTGFSKKLLQHYPSKYEKNLLTYPDIVLCNGDINRNELIENSNIGSNIISASALRQDNMIKQNIRMQSLRVDNLDTVAFSFSWDQSNYNEILDDLYSLPKKIKKIYLKFHPMYPDWLNKSDMPSRFINSKESWLEISRKCSLVIASDNSLIFEGYYYGMHTVIYDGNDPQKLCKRDFDSPIVSLNKENLLNLDSSDIIDKINCATRNILRDNYLSRYFIERNLSDSKKIFLS